jgi:hypothetical protein
MGYEYRVHVDPPIADLGVACGRVFAETPYRRIPSSLVDVPAGIGVQLGGEPVDPKWPHIADLYLETPGTIFIVCHNRDGTIFMDALAQSLRASSHLVAIDDDV